MTLEQHLDFYDIVPKERELSFSEKYLPTFKEYFMTLFNDFGYRKRETAKSQAIVSYGDNLIITMPDIPYMAGRDGGKTSRPFVYVFDRLSEIVEKIPFAEGQERTFTLTMGSESFRQFDGDIPSIGDDTLFGNAMFALTAISNYLNQRFNYFGNGMGYTVTSVGSSEEENSIKIKLKKKVELKSYTPFIITDKEK